MWEFGEQNPSHSKTRVSLRPSDEAEYVQACEDVS